MALRVGHPSDPDTDVGPLISHAHAERIEFLAKQAELAGCVVHRGASATPDLGLDPSTFARPTLVEATTDLPSWEQEVFGPMCQVRIYDGEDAVVAEVNRWRSGLGGYVVSTDLAHATELASRLRVGIIGINTATPNDPDVPFGGFDRAGIGREGAESGFRAFLEEQTIALPSRTAALLAGETASEAAKDTSHR